MSAEGDRLAGMESALRLALAQSRENARSFCALPDQTPSLKVLQAFDRISLPLNGLSGRMHLYSKVHPDARLRSRAEALEQEVADFGTELSLDPQVYQRLAAVDVSQLDDPLDRRFWEHSLRDFKRSGVDREAATRARIRALSDEIVKVGQEFEHNIIALGRSLRLPGGKGDLAGLPQDFIDAREQQADGSLLLSTDPQDRLPFLTYAQDGALRRQYFRLAQQRAFPENQPLLVKLLDLRRELSTLLGYPSWSQYVCEDKMVKSAAAAGDFLERIVKLAQPAALLEYQELLDELRRVEPQAASVGEHDRFFLSERVRRRKHAFDSQSVRPYFAYAKVRAGLFALASELYEIEFRPAVGTDRWHTSVEAYELWDKGASTPRARLFLDMHPRADKYKHAAMFHLSEGLEGVALPEAALVCNFPEPKADDPGLLLHDEVTTFFHEFGHLMHQLLGGRQRYQRFSGIATEADFVEVPSQMFEEWAWDERVLSRFAHHWQTGEAIPAELVQRMRQAEHYGKALHVMLQMAYARIALELHQCPEGGRRDLAAEVRAIRSSLSPFELDPETHMEASFGHLNGYSAMYYTYMWSLVVSKDLVGAFEGDLLDPNVARRYRQSILEAGGTSDAAELVRNFLGREYGFAAFEAWLRPSEVPSEVDSTLS